MTTTGSSQFHMPDIPDGPVVPEDMGTESVAERRVRWDAAMDLLSGRWAISREAVARLVLPQAAKNGHDPIDYAERVVAAVQVSR